jgi:hypothetical protein
MRESRWFFAEHLLNNRLQMRAMAQAIQREFRCRGAKSDRGVAKSLGQGFVIPGAEQTGHELWMMAARLFLVSMVSTVPSAHDVVDAT